MLKILGFKVAEKKCAICGEKMPAVELVAVKKLGHVCNKCVGQCEDYSTDNTKFVRKPNKRGRTWCIEFETSKKHADCLMLRKYGYIPTHDGSISGYEWKSPIFQSLRGAKQMFESMDDLAKYLNEDCGTHIHVGTLRRSQKNVIMDYDSVIFGKLVDYMVKHKQETIEFWGRYFNGYATKSFGDGRYQAFNINTGNNPTVEYRLPKFINSSQYYNVVQCCIAITDKIIETIREGEKAGIFDLSYDTISQYMQELGEKILETYLGFITVK